MTFLGKLIQTNSGAREHLFYEVPSGNRKTISVPDVERLQWSTFTCVLGPTVKGVFPPGSDVTDVNATCRSKDGSLLASGDDFGLVKLFEYPVSVSFCKDSNLIKFSIHVLLDILTSYPINKVAWIFPRKRNEMEATPKKDHFDPASCVCCSVNLLFLTNMKTYCYWGRVASLRGSFSFQ